MIGFVRCTKLVQLRQPLLKRHLIKHHPLNRPLFERLLQEKTQSWFPR